jgi:membrane protein implicated in regulation of membrane protease activity
MIWFLLLLVILIATGAFWLVLKIALGVALGVFLGILAISAFVMWRVRKAMNQAMTPPKDWTDPDGGSSQITIDYRPIDHPDYRSD